MTVRKVKRSSRDRDREPEERKERTFEEPTLPGRIEVAIDQASQVQALAFGLEDAASRALLIALGVDEDSFTVKEYSEIWQVIETAQEKGLSCDRMTVAAYAEDPKLVELAEGIRKHKPPRENVLDVVDRLRWGSAVVSAAETIPEFAELLRKRSRPEDTLKAARAIVEALETGRPIRGRNGGDKQLVERQIEAVKLRKIQGRHPFGIPGFDIDESFDEGDPKRYRTTIGVRPKKVTVVTALSGNGKSTLIANLLHAQVRTFNKKILMGAWEDEPGEVLELVAAIDQGIHLTKLLVGELSEDEERRLADSMAEFSESIEFMDHPLERVRKSRYRNDDALELIQARILESGAKLAIFDLWARAFAFGSEQEESEALYRQQAIAKATDCHVVLVQQQLLKNVEKREDKRPTREGVKGTGEWTGVADTMIGVYRADLYKNVPAGTIETPILKQRRGKWPLGIEADFDPEYGRITNCRSVPYDAPGTRAEDSKNDLDRAISGKRKGGKK